MFAIRFLGPSARKTVLPQHRSSSIMMPLVTVAQREFQGFGNMCSRCPHGSSHHAMTRFAACNIGRGATSKVSVIAQLCTSLKNPFLALQEIDVNQFKRLSKPNGMFLAFKFVLAHYLRSTKCIA